MTALECDPPETTLTGPSGATEDTTPTFELGSDEPGSTFQCRVDAAPFATCTSPWTTTVLTLGAHTVEARATDLSGNVDPTPAVRSLSVVAAPPAPSPAPETTITKAPKKKSFTSRPRLRITVEFRSSAPGTFQCSLDGAAFRSCTSPFTKKVAAGRHVLLVRAVSTAGVADPTPAAVRFKVKQRQPRQ